VKLLRRKSQVRVERRRTLIELNLLEELKPSTARGKRQGRTPLWGLLRGGTNLLLTWVGLRL
jgi:hypothetical protein